MGPGRRPTVLVIHFHHRLEAGPPREGPVSLWFQSCHRQMAYGPLPYLSLKPLEGSKAIVGDDIRQSVA